MKFWFDVPSWARQHDLCTGRRLREDALNNSLARAAMFFNENSTSQVPPAFSSSMTHNISINTTRSSMNIQQATGIHMPMANTFGQGLPAQVQPSQGIVIPPMLRPERHVFMTSKVGGHYLLSQWDTLRPRQNDKLFFRELRTQYISRRGFWRYYFGLKRFSHCDFHRVSLRPSRIFTCETDEGVIVAQKTREINFCLV